MDNKLITKSAQLQKKRKRAKRWKKFVSFMACIVVFCTTYALILPAITMEKESFCGYEEHTHEETCYETRLICTITEKAEISTHIHSTECYVQEKKLICILEETEGHAHSDACKGTEQIQICEQEEPEGHVHSDACKCIEQTQICEQEESEGHKHEEICYESTEVFVCGLEEIEPHTHDESCIAMVETNVCGQEESEGHTHDENCVGEDGTILCGQEETEGHAHNETCVQLTETMICEQEESEGHKHEETCYENTEIFVCGLEEIEAHIHDESCYEVVDVLSCEQEETDTQEVGEDETVLEEETVTQEVGEDETVSDEEIVEVHEHDESCYEQVLICEVEEHEHVLICFSNPEADLETETTWEATLPSELSGIWAEDLIAVAKSQLGYEESTKNYQVVENDATKGYTRYGAWYGEPYGDWSAMFVAFCLQYAQIPVQTMPWDSDCQNWMLTLIDRDQFVSVGNYEPDLGDLIFFSMTKNGTADRVGIVVSYEDGKVQTIEGDSNKLVEYASYQISDARILGYGNVPENPELEMEGTLDLETDGSEGDYTEDSNVSDESTGNMPLEEEETTGTTFEDWITSIVMQKVENGTGIDVPSGGTVSEEDNLQFKINYTIPSGTLSAANRTFIYQLPAEITTINAESGYVMNGNNIVGTYTISENGLITIEYYEDYAKQNANGLAMDSYITFEATVEKIESNTQGNTDIKFRDDLHVTFVVEDKIKTMCDLHVEKTTGDVDQTNGMVTYIITVTSENGTGSAVTLTDVMSNVEFKDGFTVVDKNGNAVTGVTAPSVGSEEFILTLPQMFAGDKYTITYIAQLEDILNGSVTATNKVTVNSANTGDDKLEDEAEVLTKFTNELLNKEGELSEDEGLVQVPLMNEVTVQVPESSTGTSIEGITICKVSSQNKDITLPGAVFELWRWDASVDDYMQVVVGEQSQFTTDQSGQLNITKEEHGLVYNTAYKLVEVKAPNGYIRQSEPYVFSVDSTDTNQNPICKPSDYNGVDYAPGEIIFYENTENITEITIHKLWLNVDGTTATKSNGSVTIALWRKSGDTIDELCGTYTIGAPDWKLTISDLPKNVVDANGIAKDDTYLYYIKEVNVKGYDVTYENNDGIPSGTIIVKNQDTKEYVLPETGGPGTNVYTAGGILLMCAAALLYINKKNQRKGGTLSTGN